MKVEIYRKNWLQSSNGLLYYYGLFYVPNEGSVRQEIIWQHHKHHMASRCGDNPIDDLVTRKNFGIGLYRDVMEYCITC